MKLTSLAVLIFASCIIAKNVVYLDDLLAAIEKESGNEKRDARNVVSLNDLANAGKEKPGKKREAKNVYDLKGRDAKNVYDLKGRDAKNVYELKGRDAKNVFDLKGRDAKNIFHGLKGKRDQQPEALLLESVLPQVHDISIFSGYLRDDEKLQDSLRQADSFMMFLAPSNDAIADYSAQYGSKPWSYPEPVPNDDREDEVVRKNLAYFVRAHAADSMSTHSDDRITSTLLDGREFAVEKVGGLDQYVVVLDGQTHAVSSVYSAENGLVFVVGAVLVSR